jgi:protein associated with RNAse G/E
LFSKITVPTIWYFPKNQWYNLIFAFKKNKYYCYINIAAPFIFEEEAIKYIDLDLDFEIRNITKPNLIELDQDEYEEHSKLYNYPEKLKKYILLAEQKIKEMYKNKELDKYFNIEKLKQYGK